MTLLAASGVAAGAVRPMGNFELFKKQLSQPANSYRLEFLEGDISQTKSTSVEHTSGRWTVRQPQRHYYATYQRNGFLLLQKPETIALNSVHTNVSLFVDCGRSGSQGWVRRDSAFVRLVDLDIASPDPTVQAVVDEVKRTENKTTSACFYGFPPIDASTIKWDGFAFSAKTLTGNVVDAVIDIDSANGLVSGATYNCSEGNAESGTIRYSYSGEKAGSSLPDVIEKNVSQMTNPLSAARNSFTIKLLRFEALVSSFEPQFFRPSTNRLFYVISNGIPLTRMAGKFITGPELVAARGPSQQRITGTMRGYFIRAFIVTMSVASIIGILVLCLRKKQ